MPNVDASRIFEGTLAPARLGVGADGSGTNTLADNKTWVPRVAPATSGDDEVSVSGQQISLNDLAIRFRRLLNYVATLTGEVPPGLEDDFARAQDEPN